MTPTTTIPDLFDQLQYPADPGYMPTDTSLAAAKSIRPQVTQLERVVIDMLAEYGPLTSYEIAERSGRRYSSIQPRTTALRGNGVIEDSGLPPRKEPGSKVGSTVWRLR